MTPEAKVKLILGNLSRIINVTPVSFELDCADFRCSDCVFNSVGACYVTTSSFPEIFSLVYSYIEEHHPELLI